MAHMGEVSQYQVVQLHPINVKNKAFAGCFMVVEDVRSWGCQGYIQAIGTREEAGSVAYYRADWEEMVTLDNGKPLYVFEQK